MTTKMIDREFQKHVREHDLEALPDSVLELFREAYTAGYLAGVDRVSGKILASLGESLAGAGQVPESRVFEESV